MNKTHEEVIEDFEARLLEAMTHSNPKSILDILHDNVILTNEAGEVFNGATRLPILNPDVLRICEVDILDREIALFTNVAIVNVLERRTGFYRGIPFAGLYRVTRTWKFSGRQWMLIAANVIQI